VDIVSKNGNYLLNVGPTAEGVIPQPSVERLEAMGRWLAVNGEGVYGTKAGPLQSLNWARTTAKRADPSTVYLHVFDWPAGGVLRVPSLGGPVTSARLLAGGVPVQVESSGSETVLRGPAEAPDAIDTVIELKLT
jgi:alpha-L-fucosidase